ncbi:MAG TPA: DUF3509 domain-containing protein [Pseudomonas sp.]|nr:DUF3509 domain-containing protein [Pseudomonas sp.]
MTSGTESEQALAEYSVKLTHRPDGNMLLTLRTGKKLALRKVLDGELVKSKESISSLIDDLLRDIKLASGDIAWQGKENRWIKKELPTFTGAPIQLTASKSLFSRRKINSTTQ